MPLLHAQAAEAGVDADGEAAAGADTPAAPADEVGAAPPSKSNAAADHAERKKREKEQKEKKAAWFDLKVNTSVYVTGLPDDVTEAEFAEVRLLLSCCAA